MECFTGEIRIMGFTYAPNGWAVCDGQLVPVAQWGGLFSMLRYRFGGGGDRFGLPDLRGGQIAIGTGAGTGLTPRQLGEISGTPQVTLNVREMPAHTHLVMTSSEPGDVSTPTATTALARANGGSAYHAVSNLKNLDPALVSGVRGGDNQPHENRMPYQALCYCICLQGMRTGGESD